MARYYHKKYIGLLGRTVTGLLAVVLLTAPGYIPDVPLPEHSSNAAVAPADSASLTLPKGGGNGTAEPISFHAYELPGAITSTDLEITKSVEDRTPCVGSQVEFVLKLINNGPNDATSIVVEDMLPEKLLYDEHIADDGTYDPGSGKWIVNALPNSEHTTLRIFASVLLPDPVTNTAKIISSMPDDDDDSNNERHVKLRPVDNCTDLALTKEVNDTTPKVGSQVTFTLTLTNNGPEDATGVVVSDELPDDLVWVRDDSDGAYNPGTGLWNVGPLRDQRSATLNIFAIVDVPDPVTNTAKIKDASPPDLDNDNNNDSVTLRPFSGVPRADLALTKGAYPDMLLLGSQVEFTLTLTNNGPEDATGVVVIDELPDDLVWVRDDSDGAYNPGTGLWNVGSLAENESDTLRITATAETLGPVTNTAEIFFSSLPDPLTDNDTASVAITVRSPDQDLVASRDMLDFEEVVEGEAKVDFLTVHNASNTALDVRGDIDGDDADDFEILGAARWNLTSLSQEEVIVAFTPMSLGDKQARLVFSADGRAVADTVALLGSGVTETVDVNDREALKALYKATRERETDWINDEGWGEEEDLPVRDWFGVGVTGDRVTKLELSNNNLTGTIPAELDSLDQLKVLRLDGNRLVGLPVLNLPVLETIRVARNRLTFEDLEPNIALFTDSMQVIDSTQYAPQARVAVVKDTVLVNPNSSDTLHVEKVGGKHNTYQWFLNGDSLAGAIDDTYLVTMADLMHEGTYELQIRNDSVPGLTLKSDPITVLLNDPPQAGSIPDTVIQVGDSLVVDLNTVFLDPEKQPLSYEASGSNDSVATETLEGSILTIKSATEPPGGGKAVIKVTASDSLHKSARTEFTVRTNYSPDAGEIPDTLLLKGAPDFEVDLDGVFQDKDKDILGYAKTIRGPDALVEATFPTVSTLRVVPLITKDRDSVEIIVTAKDPWGGRDSLSFTVEVDEAPTIDVTSEMETQADKPYQLKASIRDNEGIQRVFVSFRRGGQAGSEDAMMDSTGNVTYEYTIPVSAVTDKGLEYYIEATDKHGIRTRKPSSGFSSVQVRVENEEDGEKKGIVKQGLLPGGSEENAYRLISIPLDLDNKNPHGVLDDDLGKHKFDWRFYEPLPDSTLREYPNTSEMEPGKAFFLLVKKGGTVIDTGPGITVKTDTTFTIQLAPGWNAIGNPFNFDIPVSNLDLQGEKPQLCHYEGAWRYLENTEMIEPFEGYAIFNDTTGTRTLNINPDLSAQPKPAAEKTIATNIATKNDLSWSIRILARSQQARDIETVAAVAPEASADWDRRDYPEPPPIGDYVSVYFSHPEWKRLTARFSTDTRPEPDDGVIWPFEVTTTVRDKVHLRFEGFDDVPPQFEVWLVDDIVQTAQNLRQTPTYAVAAGDATDPRPLRLVVGKPGFVKGELQASREIPTQFELFPNFPNPFNPSTTIKYAVPEATAVSLVVYNMLGQKVATLMSGTEQPAGYHAVVWDGRSDAGTQVASGVYVVRMRAGRFVQTQKMVLVK